MLKALISAAYFFAAVGGTGWTDEGTDAQLIRRMPDQVIQIQAGQKEINLKALHSFTSGCESFGPYVYWVGQDHIVIDTYVSVRQGFCTQQFQDDIEREYMIEGLNPKIAYKIFFRNEEGESVLMAQMPDASAL